MSRRHVRLWRLSAALILAMALWGLGAGPADYGEGPPPPLSPGLAKARLDGGQMLGLAAGGPPNELSRLNLGRLADFKTARENLLSHLPGLGLPTIKGGRRRGYLLEYQSRRALGLIMNYEQLDSSDEPRAALDDL